MATFCLIHGNWHDGPSWDPLVGPLQARGHEVVAPDLPIDDAEAGWEERVEPVLRALDGAGSPIVLVAHSAASGYGTLAATRLDRPLLVYLCPRLHEFPAPEGAPDVFRPGFPFPGRRADGASAWEREAAIEVMYTRLDREAAEQLADRLRPTSPPPGDFPLPGPPDVATALIYAADDEFFEPEWQQFAARELLGVEPIEIPGGHFPMAEDPEALAGVLDRLAR